MPTEQILPEKHPYIKACKRGDKVALKKFWDEGISIYAASEMEYDALFQAMDANNLELMRFVLAHGYDVNYAENHLRISPLISAVEADNFEQVKLLLDAGADVNQPDAHGFSCYMRAVCGGILQEALFFEKAGADIWKKDSNGDDAFYQATHENQVHLMQHLFEKGFPINATNLEDKTPLNRAAQRGKLEACQWLLDHGAVLDIKDNSGRTALDWARLNGHTKVVKLLESYSAK